MTYNINIEGNDSGNIFNKLIWLFAYFFIALSLILNNASVLTIAVLLSIAYCIFSKAEYVFTFLCGLSMFESVFSIQRVHVWFILLLIFTTKVIYRKKMRLNASAFFSCLCVCGLEVALDYLTVSKGQLVVNLTCIVFFFCALSNIEKLNVSVFDILCSMSFAFLCVVYYVFVMDGGIGMFLKSFMSATYAYRFGHAYGDTVGGAMAIPLYAALIISCSITFLLLSDNKSFCQKIIPIASSCIALIIGAMTISRSFYLCLIVSLLLFLLLKDNRRGMAKFWTISTMTLILIVIFSTETTIVDKVFISLQNRMDAGVDEGTGGRTDIWISCVNYLIKHPLRMIFGCGASNYPQLGTIKGELFSAGSHSLFLDLLMSWGIIGFGMILANCFVALRNAIKNTTNFNEHSLIPLFTYLVFSMTALRCCNMKTWVFLLVAYVFIIKLNKEREHYDTKNNTRLLVREKSHSE